jgi:hypothetical protein
MYRGCTDLTLLFVGFVASSAMSEKKSNLFVNIKQDFVNTKTSKCISLFELWLLCLRARQRAGHSAQFSRQANR